MIKLNILNMKNFLDTVNACIGKVYMLCPNGKKQNINGEEKIQDSLWRQYLHRLTRAHSPLSCAMDK